MLKKAFIIVAVLLAGLAWGRGAAQEPADGAEASPTTDQDYVIGPGDTLNITVWRHPDLDTKTTVRPDGRISFPLVGDIRAVNVPMTELRDKIMLGLRPVIKDPRVTVNISGFDSKKISVLGEVLRPGVYAFDGRMSLLEAISQAGGYDRDSAYLNSVTVFRRWNGRKPQSLQVNLREVVDDGRLEKDIQLRPGDIVFVPRKKIFILGEVVKPGEYPFDGRMNVLEALGRAGGHSRETAYLSTVIIVRRNSEGKAEGLKVDLSDVIERARLSENIPLKAGDIVFVPKKKVFVLGEVMHPGAFTFDGPMGVLEAVSRAGGYDRVTAHLGSVLVIRRGEDGRAEGQRVNLRNVIDKADLGGDIPLMPGDVVFVPKSFIAKVDQFIDQVFTKTDPVLRYYLDVLDVRDQNTSGRLR